jgi:hypothetical protein
VGKVKIPYYVVRNGRGYFEPSAKMKSLGFESTPCGPDGPGAWAQAKKLADKWRDWSAQEAERTPSVATRRGSLREAFQRYRRTKEWEKKAPRTREEWERAWARIAPIFGDADPKQATLEEMSDFRELIASTVSQREAHRCIKIWRALWRVAAALGYCALDRDPSLGVRNTEPQARQALWTHIESWGLCKTAWRSGYYGLAAVIAVAWDSMLSPVDARQLTPAQRSRDGGGDVFRLGRAKTGRAALATLSRASSRVVDAYLAQLGVEIAPDAPMFRNRSGRPYSKDQLGKDFRKVREIAFGAAETRTLADFRRSGTIEALRGGASLTIIGHKAANDMGSNPSLGRTYAPIDLAAVRAADEARRKGRK